MEKTIKLDNKASFKVSNNSEWLYIYRNQFGTDIAPLLMPILNAGVRLAVSIAKVSDTTGEKPAEILKKLDADDILDAVYSLAGLETVDLINIAWSMAKTANEEIDEPRAWAKSLGVFPVDIIAPELFGLAADCLISSKNLKRLKSAAATLMPSISMPSTSRDSSTD